MHDARTRADHFDDRAGELKHREFARITNVYRARDLILRRHEFDQPIDEIIDVAERTRLRAVPVNRQDRGQAGPG